MKKFETLLELPSVTQKHEVRKCCRKKKKMVQINLFDTGLPQTICKTCNICEVQKVNTMKHKPELMTTVVSPMYS